MKKLSLVNLAQDQLGKDVAQKIKGGVECTCDCSECPQNETVAYKTFDRVDISVG